MRRARGRPAVVLVPLALLFLVTGLVEAWRDSPTVDETIDIASGVTSLVRHDLRLVPEHGVLTKVVPALPALLGHPVVPAGPSYLSGEWTDHVDEFVDGPSRTTSSPSLAKSSRSTASLRATRSFSRAARGRDCSAATSISTFRS